MPDKKTYAGPRICVNCATLYASDAKNKFCPCTGRVVFLQYLKWRLKLSGSRGQVLAAYEKLVEAWIAAEGGGCDSPLAWTRRLTDSGNSLEALASLN
jgi:hypothetical protein